MKKPEITPGPWNLRTALYSAHITNSGLPVADVQACHHEPWRANATAIAALPDLLEALECCLPDWHAEDDLTQHDGLPAGEISLGDMRAIKAALTKAGYTFD